MEASSVAVPALGELERHRPALIAHCYRMLGSPFEAEDAVQETLLRAWRARERFEGRSALRSWLYRIATNVCFDMLGACQRRARPMDMGPARAPEAANLESLPQEAWIEPAPSRLLASEGDPAEAVAARETVRLAFVAALQRLPARQRAALLLCEVLGWSAAETAELLGTSVASVNSALQRARATLREANEGPAGPGSPLRPEDDELLARYVDAFERYDMEALETLIRDDARQSMPPYSLWLQGREDILAWWLGPGIGCRGSRVLPAPAANGSPTFAQYKPSESSDGYDAWALQVLELAGGRVAELTFFLDVERIFPLFGLPTRLDR